MLFRLLKPALFALGVGLSVVTLGTHVFDTAEFAPQLDLDTLDLDSGLHPAIGNDLEVAIIGTSDKATVQNWYSGQAFHIEQFRRTA